MPPTLMNLDRVMYAPSQDMVMSRKAVASRHRKSLSTGGGRAWSESEEAYLIQTRSQKMPYKHIAAHLNKTELACRLHYHQISHGSSRRKRNLSCSSVETDYSRLFRERSVGTDSRMSPSSRLDGMASSPAESIRLPSIMGGSSPTLPALLPKPQSLSPPREIPSGYPEGQRMLPNIEHYRHPLKLDLASLPSASTPSHNTSHVDLPRLHAIYDGHRNAFWAAIASEYGHEVTPSNLERAWRSNRCCCSGQRSQSPMTPSASPVVESREWLVPHDKTSMSSILGPDAASRSAWDRDMIRRMEVS